MPLFFILANVSFFAELDDHDALYRLVIRSEVTVLKRALDQGADANSRDVNEYTLLHQAARFGHKAVAELLISYKADVNAGTRDGETPLHMAAQKKFWLSKPRVPPDHKGVIAVLLANKADPNAEQKGTGTPLHSAVRSGDTELIQLLLDQGAHVEPVTKVRYSPLHVAALEGHDKIADLLIKQGARIDVFASAGLGKINRLNAILEDDPKQARARLGRTWLTPLHFASMRGQVETAKLLLKQEEVIVNALSSPWGQTPLHMAAKAGHLEMVKLLLSNKAAINPKTMMGSMTPLSYAIEGEHPRVMELLERHGGVDR